MSYSSAQSAGQPRPRPPQEPGPRPVSPQLPGAGPTPGCGDTTVKIPVGYSGIISGLSRSQRTQNAIVTISAADGRKIFQSILVGSGEDKPMTEEIDPNSTGIAFGPFNYEATVIITIKNASLGGSDFHPSTVISPITVTKTPSSAHPNHIRVTTILSEDGTDNDFNDAIISIFAFKSAS